MYLSSSVYLLSNYYTLKLCTFAGLTYLFQELLPPFSFIVFIIVALGIKEK
jgi:hypothetical protein